jgi:2-C-methyl-D-erythritol 4-phosphate cytidylyltransferase
MKQNKTIAIILAGGSGERFGNELPKQFIKLAGKPIIEYTLNNFQSHSSIDEIIVVIKKEFEEKLWNIVKKNNFNKVTKIIYGGKDRFNSTYAALRTLENENEDIKVIFHDAVRPLIDKKTIDRVIKALNYYDAVDTAIDATDTIIEIDYDWIIENIPNRKYMKRGQTPQGFRLKTIKNAYKKAINENKNNFTCDCGVVNKMLKIPIKVVKSTIKNIKITYPIDLYIAEKYIQMGIEDNLNEVNLKNLKGKNIVIFGNSSGIGKEIEKIALEYGANVYGGSRKSGVDIRDKKTIEKFLLKIENVNIIINTAAILIKKPIKFVFEDEINDIIDINYKGTVNIALIGRKILEKTNGMLINFASSSYTRGRANYSLYSSSKAAIVNLTQALSEEWENIKVNCVVPQRTNTPMREKNFGYEEPSTLLNPYDVALKTLKLALSNKTGIILEIKNDLD